MPLGDQATNVKRQVSASKLPTLDHSEFALNEVFMTGELGRRNGGGPRHILPHDTILQTRMFSYPRAFTSLCAIQTNTPPFKILLEVAEDTQNVNIPACEELCKQTSASSGVCKQMAQLCKLRPSLKLLNSFDAQRNRPLPV